MTLFVTEYDGPDGTYGDTLEALDWGHAEMIGNAMDPPRRILGEHVLTISAEHMTPEKADAMCRAFANEVPIQ